MYKAIACVLVMMTVAGCTPRKSYVYGINQCGQFISVQVIRPDDPLITDPSKGSWRSMEAGGRELLEIVPEPKPSHVYLWIKPVVDESPAVRHEIAWQDLVTVSSGYLSEFEVTIEGAWCPASPPASAG